MSGVLSGNMWHIQQKDEISCGEKCVLMTLRRFGIKTHKQKVQKILKTKKNDGTYQKDIVAALKYFKLDYFVVSLLNKKRGGFTSPPVNGRYKTHAICCVDNNGHWLIVRGFTQKSILIADPALSGFSRMSFDKFNERLRGGSCIFVYF